MVMSRSLKAFLVPFLVGVLIAIIAAILLAVHGPFMAYAITVVCVGFASVIVGSQLPRDIAYAGWWMNIPIWVPFVPATILMAGTNTAREVWFMWTLPLFTVGLAYLGLFLGARLVRGRSGSLPGGDENGAVAAAE